MWGQPKRQADREPQASSKVNRAIVMATSPTEFAPAKSTYCSGSLCTLHLLTCLAPSHLQALALTRPFGVEARDALVFDGVEAARPATRAAGELKGSIAEGQFEDVRNDLRQLVCAEELALEAARRLLDLRSQQQQQGATGVPDDGS